MRVNDLTIALFYEHPEAGTWPLLELANHQGVIAPNDLAPEAFYDAAGSMRCFSDRVMCFLSVGAAGELRYYVYFLLGTLVSLAGGGLAAEFPEVPVESDFFGERNVLAGLFQENQTRIFLQDTGGVDVSLSYLDSEGDAPNRRLNPYFRSLMIERRIWWAAATVALDEYVHVAEERLRMPGGGQLKSLVNRWNKHRSALSMRPGA